MTGPPKIALDDKSLERIYAVSGRRTTIEDQDLLIPWKRLDRVPQC